jgi:HD-GYP domain-containing protein (c-di-GMP phosphodiesterase class II)
LRRLVIVSVGLALMAFAVVDLWQEAQSYLAGKRETLLATANIVAGASSTAVALDDVPQIKESLRSISRVPGLAYARAESTDGRVLAEVGAASRLADEVTLGGNADTSIYTLLLTRTVTVVVPIVHAGRPVGRLLLIGGTGDLFSRFLDRLVLGSLGALMAVLIGLLIAQQMQISIARPLTALANDMARIARTHDYSTSLPDAPDQETKALAGSFNVMMKEIRRAYVAISDREAELIFRLSRATEQRDNETGEHIMRMATLCGMIGKGLGLDGGEVEALQRAAPLHDVGKLGVPDRIMFKSGALDQSERREMERHTSYGYEILRDSKSDLIRLAGEMAWSHHEKWDGTGYPRGLKGKDIPLAGRVAAVADVCDALASERSYKPAWELYAVRAYLIENSGKHFDPDCVEALLRQWDEVERMYATQQIPAEAPRLWASAG